MAELSGAAAGRSNSIAATERNKSTLGRNATNEAAERKERI